MVSAKLRQGARVCMCADQPLHVRACAHPLLLLLTRTQHARPRARADWGTVCVANWKLWVPFQFLNFRFVPPPLQARVCPLTRSTAPHTRAHTHTPHLLPACQLLACPQLPARSAAR
jgi:hypothetical protein